MKAIRQIGTQSVIRSGDSLIIRPPTEWLAEHGLKVGDPVYSVVTLDETIRYHLTDQPWARRSKVRQIKAAGWLLLAAPHAKSLGVSKGDTVALSIDIGGEVLMVRRVP